MRRLALILALAGVMAVPAVAAAADPPEPMLGVTNAHYTSTRGEIEVDVTWRCVAPASRDAEWYPYLYVSLSQGRRNTRWGESGIPLDARSCDGATHVQVVRIRPEEGRGFKGGRVMVYGELEAGWWEPDADDGVGQWTTIEGRMHVRRR